MRPFAAEPEGKHFAPKKPSAMNGHAGGGAAPATCPGRRRLRPWADRTTTIPIRRRHRAQALGTARPLGREGQPPIQVRKRQREVETRQHQRPVGVRAGDPRAARFAAEQRGAPRRPAPAARSCAMRAPRRSRSACPPGRWWRCRPTAPRRSPMHRSTSGWSGQADPRRPRHPDSGCAFPRAAAFLDRPGTAGPPAAGQAVRAQVEHDSLMRKAAAGHRDRVPPVELIPSLLPVFPGKEGLRGPRPVQHGVHKPDPSRGRHPASTPAARRPGHDRAHFPQARPIVGRRSNNPTWRRAPAASRSIQPSLLPHRGDRGGDLGRVLPIAASRLS